MKRTKFHLLTGFITCLYFSLNAQPGSIVGDWQLVKKSTCLEESASNDRESLENLRDDMHSRSSVTPQVVSFKANSTGEESTRILNSGKVANPKKFYYKFNGEVLFILDKKSQTISDSYVIDKFTADSLIISNASRPCETRIFVKLNTAPPN